MIHWKFRHLPQNTYTIHFAGNTMNAKDVQDTIRSQRRITPGDDIEITNEQTRQVYHADEPIHKNTTVIIRRIPPIAP